MPLPSFLDTKQTVKLPTGGDFGPNSFIGPFMARVLYSFYSSVDLVQEWKAMDAKPTMVSRRKMGANGHRYYFDNAEAAVAALKLSGNDEIKSAGQVWTFYAESKALLNLAPEHADKFGDSVQYDVDLLTLRSKKRHPFQLMSLPSAVAAMAKLLGYGGPGFSLSELTSQDAIFTDEFQAQMVGHPDGDYEKSVLWQRRVALWAHLGEKDARKYNRIGTGTKFDTTSERLSDCLAIVGMPWSGPAYLKLVQVLDPRLDAVYGDEKKRLSIPCIYTVYPSVKEAKVEAEAEMAQRKAGAESKAGVSGTNGSTPISTGLPLPANWDGLRDEFITEVKATRDQALQVAAKGMSITPQELKAWRAEVGA